MLQKPEFTLAELVDWLALPGGPRDRSLVRQVTLWCHDQAARLQLPAVAGWRDVVVTLRATDRVKLVVTGTRLDAAGAWTWEVAEGDFPAVDLCLHSHGVLEPHAFAMLDTAMAGRTVLLPTGDRATVVVTALVEGRDEVRVRTSQGHLATFAAADIAWR